MRTARAKGISERQILLRHVLRNAMIPIVTLWGLRVRPQAAPGSSCSA